MEDELVSYQIALSARIAGFNEPCIDMYKGENLVERYEIDTMDEMTIEEVRKSFEVTNNECLSDAVTAPTQALLCRWLREKHKTQVQALWVGVAGVVEGWTWEITGIGHHTSRITPQYVKIMKTYEQALDAGLYVAIEGLLETQRFNE